MFWPFIVSSVAVLTVAVLDVGVLTVTVLFVLELFAPAVSPFHVLGLVCLAGVLVHLLFGVGLLPPAPVLGPQLDVAVRFAVRCCCSAIYFAVCS